MARDHDCAVLVDGLARVFDRTAEFLNLLHVHEIEESPKDTKKQDQVEADFDQFGLEMIFAAPLILCEAFNDRRLARHTDSGSCLNYDERMDGSALDLGALIAQNSDKLSHAEGIAPPPSDPQSNDALAEIARARFLHQYPIGSSTEKATAWLQSLGFACETDECRFRVDEWAYYPGNSGFGTYEWIIAFRRRAGQRSAVGAIAYLEVRLLEGQYP